MYFKTFCRIKKEEAFFEKSIQKIEGKKFYFPRKILNDMDAFQGYRSIIREEFAFFR